MQLASSADQENHKAHETDRLRGHTLAGESLFSQLKLQAQNFFSRLHFELDESIFHFREPYTNFNFARSGEHYLRELEHLSQLSHPLHRASIFRGLGLYTECGADPGPYLVSSHFGRLVVESLHEGELLSFVAVGKAFGLRGRDILGNNVECFPISRDAHSILPRGAPKPVIDEVVERLTERELGFWEHFMFSARAPHESTTSLLCNSRMIEWKLLPDGRQGLTFVPSAAGDTNALNQTLSHYGRTSFDYVWLKGTLDFRFRGNLSACLDWLETLEKSFLHSGSVVLVAESDSAVIPFYEARNYSELQRPYSVEPANSWGECVQSERIPADIGGIYIPHVRTLPMFRGHGNFRIFIKP